MAKSKATPEWATREWTDLNGRTVGLKHFLGTSATPVVLPAEEVNGLPPMVAFYIRHLHDASGRCLKGPCQPQVVR